MQNLKLDKLNPIGIFDSGVGGIGVLKEIKNILPNENYIFYGDSLHAPYGEKTPEQIFELVQQVVEHLLSKQVKMIIIACNTATSVAAAQLREMYKDLPIIGMEPALKQAISKEKKNKVLVMATPVTLHLEKYQHLLHQLEDEAEYISVECPGLAKRIEQGRLEENDLIELLDKILKKQKEQLHTVDNIVLGCTHYPFIKKQIKQVVGDIPLIDGGHGTALQVKRVLENRNLLNDSGIAGKIILESSKQTEKEIELYQTMYDLYQVD